MSTALPHIRGYRVLRLLGAGGMGQVFLARDETLERRVAIKMIAAPLASEGIAHSRFLREARAMAGVEHPHVVRVYAFGEVEGQPYIVMEYVEGVTLAARLAGATRLAVEEALRITHEVAQALAAAWSRGIVHRDVKPANILLDADDRVKVADFGLARAPAGDAEVTGAGMVVGTAHYMSPEQARGDQTDFRSDVYSLGVVLYEMLGRESRPDVPPDVATLVAAMTANLPAARPASYRALLRSLTSAEGSRPVRESASPSKSTRAWPRAARPRRFHGWIALGVALALIAAALGVVFGPWNTRHGSFAVAVAPFYGADPESEKEGRVLASLLEGELTRRLPEDDVDVLGVEEVRKAVRGPRAARALAERLEVDVLVWGEALAFQGEVELAARVTRRDGTLVEAGGPGEMLRAGAPNAIALRRARAIAVVDKVAEIYGRR